MKGRVKNMTIHIYRVNAFANNLTSGNPAYIIKGDDFKSEHWMQQLAKELNQPITAFLSPDQKEKDYVLRWFTPLQEINLCGHGTLAAAHILWEENEVMKEHPIFFATKSGRLKATYVDEGIRMSFPSDPSKLIDPPHLLQRALGVSIKNVEKMKDRYIVELENEQVLREIEPAIDIISNLPVIGVIVTSPSTNYDFVSRYFAPAIGIEEDFVTGSAHCGLAPYWSKRLGKNKLYAFQASKRGGELYVEHKGDITYITGKAYTVYKGTIL